MGGRRGTADLGIVVILVLVATGCAGRVTSTGDTGDVADAGALDSFPLDGAPAWSACLGRTPTYGSCEEYCAQAGVKCSATCTTSRGYPNWAAEAFTRSSGCAGFGGGQQTCAFSWDDDVGSIPRWKCCCHRLP
jgi:hypothetical protein